MTSPFVRAVWRAERWTVDRARAVVARIQPLPNPPPHHDGPLQLSDAQAPLDFVASHPLMQPDRTSCGSSSLVMMRMLRDPSYAEVVLGNADPDTAFGNAALGVRRRTNAGLDANGGLQLPWPASLGVRPAAMIRLLEAPEGFGDPGRRYHNVVIDPADAGPVLGAIVASVHGGEPVPLYVGDGRWMQHIVLVVRASGGSLSVYDPAVGHEVDIDREEFLHGDMRVAGWRRPWLAILAA